MQLSEKSNVLILSHYYKRTIAGGGPPQEVRDFLIPKVKNIHYIEHPFPSSDDHRSSMTIYRNGILEKQIFTPSIIGPQVIYYLTHILFTFYFILRANTKFDLCIALDNLNTVSVIPFKKIGLIKKLVFYTIDYIPKRFENNLLNDIYHLIDQFACYNADKIWILSERMTEERQKNKVNIKRSAPSILLPMGANLSRIEISPFEKINRYDLVFVGSLIERQGVQLVLEALPKVISKIPHLRFIIIGQGEYEQQLKLLVKKMNIYNHVRFDGFIKDYNLVENILCKSAVAVAPYVPKAENFAFFTDPGKPKLYLGCGLPVVITDVPAIARVIKSQKAGIIAGYTEESFASALTKLFLNDVLYKNYRENAIKLSKKYDTNNLIKDAIEKT